MRESQEFPGSIEGTIKLDKDTCCALERGFIQNLGVVRELEEVVDEERMKLYTDILINTDEMKFVPTAEMKMVYSQIAKRELERIGAEDEDDEDLKCGHSVEEHKEALKEVLEKMEPTLN